MVDWKTAKILERIRISDAVAESSLFTPYFDKKGTILKKAGLAPDIFPQIMRFVDTPAHDKLPLLPANEWKTPATQEFYK